MSSRKPSAAADSRSPKGRPARRTFRQRYDELEDRRSGLVARLRRLGEKAERHPSYKRALTLLNDTFRKSKLTQRVAVLEAASWLIDLLEKLTITL